MAQIFRNFKIRHFHHNTLQSSEFTVVSSHDVFHFFLTKALALLSLRPLNLRAKHVRCDPAWHYGRSCPSSQVMSPTCSKFLRTNLILTDQFFAKFLNDFYDVCPNFDLDDNLLRKGPSCVTRESLIIERNTRNLPRIGGF